MNQNSQPQTSKPPTHLLICEVIKPLNNRYSRERECETRRWKRRLTTPAGEELSTSESWCVWICAGRRESERERERKKIEIDIKNSIGRERVTHHMPKCPQVSHKPPFVALLGKGNLAFQRTLHAKAKIHIWKRNSQALSYFVCWRKTFWCQSMCLEVAKLNKKCKTVEDFCFGRVQTDHVPNQACWSPCTSMASPKSASLTAAFLHLLAKSRFSGWGGDQGRTHITAEPKSDTYHLLTPNT